MESGETKHKWRRRGRSVVGSLALSAYGTTVAAGAIYYDDSGDGSGHLCVFGHDGPTIPARHLTCTPEGESSNTRFIGRIFYPFKQSRLDGMGNFGDQRQHGQPGHDHCVG